MDLTDPDAERQAKKDAALRAAQDNTTERREAGLPATPLQAPPGETTNQPGKAPPLRVVPRLPPLVETPTPWVTRGLATLGARLAGVAAVLIPSTAHAPELGDGPLGPYTSEEINQGQCKGGGVCASTPPATPPPAPSPPTPAPAPPPTSPPATPAPATPSEPTPAAPDPSDGAEISGEEASGEAEIAGASAPITPEQALTSILGRKPTKKEMANYLSKVKDDTGGGSAAKGSRADKGGGALKGGHSSGGRPSTREKHEAGDERRRKDQGGEKGDKRRPY